MNEKQFTIIWVVALVIILLAGSGAIWYLQFEVLVREEGELDAVKAQVATATTKKNRSRAQRSRSSSWRRKRRS